MEGFTKRKILARIDYIGAALSIVGITLFLVALQAGGYSHSWESAYVLVQLIVGILLIIAWIVWEAKFAKFPMVPKEMFQGQRIVAGMDFYSVINFFPLSFGVVYDLDPVPSWLERSRIWYLNNRGRYLLQCTALNQDSSSNHSPGCSHFNG
jgi:membrane protease YdiL (CAAX protease family)